MGKCAGSTIKLALSDRLPDDCSLIEFHCFDANKLIEKYSRVYGGDDYFVVAARDPISRFISAYNWDKHNLLLKGRIKRARFVAYYEEFFPMEYFAQSLTSGDSEIRARALNFAKFGHMIFWGHDAKVPLMQL